MVNKLKCMFVTFLFMTMFLGILINIAIQRPGSIVSMSYAFAVLGVWYFTRLLYAWLRAR